MSGEQIDEILNKKREINIIKERNMNQKLFIFERVRKYIVQSNKFFSAQILKKS